MAAPTCRLASAAAIDEEEDEGVEQNASTVGSEGEEKAPLHVESAATTPMAAKRAPHGGAANRIKDRLYWTNLIRLKSTTR